MNGGDAVTSSYELGWEDGAAEARAAAHKTIARLREALDEARRAALSGAAGEHLDGAGIMQNPPHSGKFADCHAPWCVRSQTKLAGFDAALAETAP